VRDASSVIVLYIYTTKGRAREAKRER